jgi:hypothetical protein
MITRKAKAARFITPIRLRITVKRSVERVTGRVTVPIIKNEVSVDSAFSPQ